MQLRHDLPAFLEQAKVLFDLQRSSMAQAFRPKAA
jgi:hypothetical protein